MNPALILIRHAMPEVTPEVHSAGWPLSQSAKEDCVLLAHSLPRSLAPVVYTSPEVKAHETAAVIALRRGLQVAADPGFGEVDHPYFWDEDYREAAATYLRVGAREAWEPPEAVVARFAAAVDRARSAHPEGDLLIVNHGLALSLYLAAHAPIDLVPFWRALTFPDAWRFDPTSATLTRVYHAGLPPP